MSNPRNRDLDKPWNDTCRRSDQFEPWDDPMKKDDPFACWNQIDGQGNYEEECK